MRFQNSNLSFTEIHVYIEKQYGPKGQYLQNYNMTLSSGNTLFETLTRL